MGKLDVLPTRLRSLLVNCCLALFSLIVAFLLGEVASRLYLHGGLMPQYGHLPPLIREPDPDTGWHLAPNQQAVNSSLDFELVIRTNAEGLRDPEREAAADPDDFTIVVLGDSYMEASHVPEDAAFCRVLESALGDGHRVINLGVGGFSTVQSWQQFLARGRAYSPDLVLLAFYAENDIYGNSAELSQRMWGADNARYFSVPFATLEDDGLTVVPPQYERARTEYEAKREKLSPMLLRLEALTDSALEKIYKQAISRFRQKVHEPGDEVAIHLGAYTPHPYETAPDPTRDAAWKEALAVTESVLERLNQDAADVGADFAVFTVPSKLQTESAYWEMMLDQYPEMDLERSRPHRWLAARCKGNNIPFLDLLPVFREAEKAGAELNHMMEDSHWNAHGHALAAKQVARWLSDLIAPDPRLEN